MATKQQQSLPKPAAQSKITDGEWNGAKTGREDVRTVVIVFGREQESILSVFADVLGKPYRLAPCFAEVDWTDTGTVIGIAADDARIDISSRDKIRIVVIHGHCINMGMPPDPHLSAECDFEFLYTETPFFRRHLSRFTSFVLGQINHHEDLIAKPRTYFISTTFSDVRPALSNLDILSVGADALELRVDLLKEPLSDGSCDDKLPSLSYVGSQVSLLRQRTELPLIFTSKKPDIGDCIFSTNTPKSQMHKRKWTLSHGEPRTLL